ncbi:MAG: outer membrane lipoprotein-sorting protein [Spirochaetales bacterium]|nr:outer membrane lipoprotein-sorting protein [Spirochaetales bacterium]
MNRTTKTGLLSLMMFIAFASSLFAQTTANDIAAKAMHQAFYLGDDSRTRAEMVITDNNGKIRTRTFVFLRKDKVEDKEQSYYFYFSKPSDVRKMVLLVQTNITQGDHRWLYIPALDLVKRIAASDVRNSFVGSDFFYEDLSGRVVNVDTHEIIEENENSYILRNVPVDKESVEFAYYDVVIDKNSFLPMKAEYYNKANQKYRIVKALETEVIQGFPTITKIEVSNIDTGSNTVLSFSRVEYNIGMNDDIFTERYLRRTPRVVR